MATRKTPRPKPAARMDQCVVACVWPLAGMGTSVTPASKSVSSRDRAVVRHVCRLAGVTTGLTPVRKADARLKVAVAAPPPTRLRPPLPGAALGPLCRRRRPGLLCLGPGLPRLQPLRLPLRLRRRLLSLLRRHRRGWGSPFHLGRGLAAKDLDPLPDPLPLPGRRVGDPKVKGHVGFRTDVGLSKG